MYDTMMNIALIFAIHLFLILYCTMIHEDLFIELLNILISLYDSVRIFCLTGNH